ncbi:MAG TPA: phytanoyl-CoA dioxygenase family protein [Abditibacteriaceae bacterium]|jgi:hypothetical protein
MSQGLTPAQRFHFDAYGYVLLPNVLSAAEVASMKDALYRIKSEPNRESLGIYVNSDKEHILHVGHIVEYDSALLNFVMHPRLLPLIEDVVGGAVRLEETEAIINRRNPALDVAALRQRRLVPTGFHTGIRHGWGTYEANNRFQCLFVKTIAFLTDVGPQDGGTAVIPGSHKMSWPEPEMIAAAQEDESLIHQVEATAGSVLLFAESLIHSTTEIFSDNERLITVAGYTPTMFQPWPGNEISPAFLETLPEDARRVLSGSDSWHWRRKSSN